MVIDNGVKLNKEAVLSISGGLDSTSLLIHLLDKDYDKVHAISFYYGQKNEIELQRLDLNLRYLKFHKFDITYTNMNLSSFMSKFGEYGSYNKIKEDDPFGYVMQGHLYGEGENVPFGGWIAINKVTGEFAVCKAPDNQEKDRKEDTRMGTVWNTISKSNGKI